jgi:hypothetical protein
MELITLRAWAIWMTSNAKIFRGSQPNLYICMAIFKEELKWLKYRGKRKSYN